jgi:hypothetical protein
MLSTAVDDEVDEAMIEVELAHSTGRMSPCSQQIEAITVR